MRIAPLALVVTTLALAGPGAAAPQVKSASGAIRSFTETTNRIACANLRKDIKTCAVKVTSATRNSTGPEGAIWAFTGNVSAPLALKGEARDIMRISLERNFIQVMQPIAEGFTVVAYYREDAAGFTPVNTDVFAAAALNPVDKVVARYDADFAAAEGLAYQLPAVWSVQGVSPGTEDEMNLKFTLSSSSTYSVEAQDLDDAALKDLSITACTVTATAGATACDAAAIALPAGKSELKLRLAARRKIKSNQPAFKMVVRRRSDNVAVLQLAIPFKPQPNYFLFGITGFLFGGLIAVMVLFLKKNPRAASPV
ncbi:hypothetical protein [Turneriella parva]|nr:hypothetical protein [Turneriella parva]